MRRVLSARESSPGPFASNRMGLDAWIGVCLLLLGMTATAGWLLRQPSLLQIVPELVPMVFNTGLGFLGLGTAFVLGSRPWRAAPMARTIVAAAVVALGVATLVELIIDRPLGIDFASMHTWFDYGNTRPGRMAPNTAFGFVLAGAALLAADRVRNRAWALAAVGLTFALLAVGLMGLVGYLLAPDLLFGWARSARMAVQTASGMILAALGLWSSWSRQPWYKGEAIFREDKKIRLISAVTVAVVTVTAGLTGFVLLQYSFEQSLATQLVAVVDARVPRFHETLIQHRTRASTEVASTGLAASTTRWLAAPDDASRRLDLARDAAKFLAAGYRGVTVERYDGSVVARFGLEAGTRAFLAAIDGTEGSELTWDEQALLRTHHAVGNTGERLVVEQTVPEMVQALIDTARLGESVQVAACIRREGALICLPDSRNSTIYTVPPRGGAYSLPMERALAGGQGTAYAVDYRGHNVVAALGQLTPGLGLVVKQDTREAYAPIRRALSMGTPIIVLAALLGGWLMTWQLAPLVGRLRLSERLASEGAAKTAAIMHAAGDAIVTIDQLGHMQAANDAAHRIFGYADGKLIGQKVSMLIPASTWAVHEQGLARVAAGGPTSLLGSSDVQVTGLRSDGTEFPLELTLRAVPLPGHSMFVGVMRDVTERRAMENKLSRMAQFDSLTGLPNRALFMDRLDSAMARVMRSNGSLAIMFLDLDGFKAINDTWGHLAGDEVLVQIAERLGSGVRRTDTVARLGGDEFTFLLEELNDPEADSRAIADKLMNALRAPMNAAGQTITVTASIGIVLHRPGDPPANVSELLSRADGAMYAAKRAAKNARTDSTTS